MKEHKYIALNQSMSHLPFDFFPWCEWPRLLSKHGGNGHDKIFRLALV